MPTTSCFRSIATALLTIFLVFCIIFSSSSSSLVSNHINISTVNQNEHSHPQSLDVHNQTATLTSRGLTCTLHEMTDPREFNVAMETGDRFMAYFAGARPVPASPKYSYHDLEAWGWTSQKRSFERTEATLKPIKDVLEAKRWSVDARKWQDIERTHSKTTRHGRKGFVATNARYSNLYNAGDGIVIARSNHGPANRAPNLPKPDLPTLHHWSDITFLELSHLASPNPSALKNLHSILRYRIQTASALTIILNALKLEGEKAVPAWPGHTFTATKNRRASMSGMLACSHSYRAMMGLPHVTGVAWLLLQHKEAFGDKGIGSITVFDSDKSKGELVNGEVNLLVEIVGG